MTRMRTTSIALLATVALGAGGCQSSDAVERDVQDAAEEVKKKAEDAGREVEKSAEDAGREVEKSLPGNDSGY